MSLRGLWWSLGVAGVAVVIALSLVPQPPSLPGDEGGWLAHVLAYAVMMGWFARLVPAGRARFAAAATFCVLGVLLEYVQRETGYRTMDTADMLADALGVAVGWLMSPPRAPHGLAELDRVLSRAVKRASPHDR